MTAPVSAAKARAVRLARRAAAKTRGHLEPVTAVAVIRDRGNTADVALARRVASRGFTTTIGGAGAALLSDVTVEVFAGDHAAIAADTLGCCQAHRDQLRADLADGAPHSGLLVMVALVDTRALQAAQS